MLAFFLREGGTMQKRIAEGNYQFWIVRAQAHCGRLNVTFQIARDRQFLGLTISKSFALECKAVSQLREMLEACCRQIQDGAMQLKVNKLIGLECAGLVVYACGIPMIKQFFRAREPQRQFQHLWA